jgi:hypothetical protein
VTAGRFGWSRRRLSPLLARHLRVLVQLCQSGQMRRLVEGECGAERDAKGGTSSSTGRVQRRAVLHVFWRSSLLGNYDYVEGVRKLHPEYCQSRVMNHLDCQSGIENVMMETSVLQVLR